MKNKRQDIFIENCKISLGLEKSLVSYVVTKPDEVFEMYSIVQPKHFYGKENARMYELVMRSQVEKIDLVSLVRKEALSENFMISSYFEEASLVTFSTRDFKSIAEQIKKLSQVRDVMHLFSDSVLEIDHMNFDSKIPVIQSKFMEICTLKDRERSTAKEMLEDYQKVQNENSEKIESGKSIIGMSCGFGKLDEAIDGFRPEHMWTVMAYTSVGKSTFTLNMVASLIEKGSRVVFYSLEMSKVDIISRLLGIMTKMNGRKILKYQMDQKDFDKVQEKKSVIEKSGLSIHTELSDIDSIRLSMMEEVLRGKVDLFVIDYIQQVQVAGSNSIYEQMSRAADIIQVTAKQLRLPIVVVSQISNEMAKAKTSEVIGAKGAGEIAAKSDFILWLQSNEENINTEAQKIREGKTLSVKAKIMKNRHGDTGYVVFDFDRRTGVFKEEDISKDFNN